MAGQPERTQRRFWWMALLLLLLGMGLRGWFFQLPTSSDDFNYFQHAVQGVFTPRAEPGHGSLRLALVGFIALPVALLGNTLAGFHGAVYLHALLMGLGMLLFSLVLAGRRSALWMTLLWALSYTFLIIDTRLLPDTLGTGLALLGLAALGWAAPLANGGEGTRQDDLPPPAPAGWAPWMALLGGLLLWAACSVRATFLFHALIGPLLVWHSRRRGLLLPLLAGGLLGGGLELAWAGMVYGDPLLRLKVLAGYGRVVEASPLFQGLDWQGFLLRYPRMLINTGSGELLFLPLAALGAGLWLARWRRPRARVKLLGLLLTSGVILLAVTRFDPPVPYLRHQVRYYLTALPFLYLAAVEGVGWASRRLGPRLGHPLAVPLAGALLLLGLAVFNARVAGGFYQLARNGNDAYLAAARALQREVAEQPPPHRLQVVSGSAAIWSLFLPPEGGWRVDKGGLEALDEPGFLWLDWFRLTRNVHQGHLWGETTHQLYRLMETRPVVFRRQAGARIATVLNKRPAPAPRSREPLAGWPAAAGWQRVSDGAAAAMTTPITLSGGDVAVSGGAGWPGPPAQVPALPERRLLQLLFQGRGAPAGTLEATLLRWDADGTPREPLTFGTFSLDDQRREVAGWVPLEGEAARWRLLLRGTLGRVTLEGVTLQLLGELPGDRLFPPPPGEGGREP